MSILVRGAVGQQAGAGVLVRKGVPGVPAPHPPGGIYGGLPGEELPASPGTPIRGPIMLGPPEYLAALLGLLNILVNRLKDNQREEDNEKCKIYAYSEAEKECPIGRSHHIVPDRCWRSPGTRRQTTGRPSFGSTIDQLLDKFLEDRGGGYYYAKKMDEKKGQCICVTEEEHLAIHAVYDQLEGDYGENANPQWIATLEKLEGLGAMSVAAVTRCNETKIRKTLRDQHQALNLDKDVILRADPRGKSGLTMPKFVDLLSRVQQAKQIK